MLEIAALDDLETECWALLLDHDQDMIALSPFDFGLGFALGRGLGTDTVLKLGNEMRNLWNTALSLCEHHVLPLDPNPERE